MTKHSFLDKIKSAAKSSKSSESGGNEKRKKIETEGNDNPKEQHSNSPAWGALKDDYMLNPKKVR